MCLTILSDERDGQAQLHALVRICGGEDSFIGAHPTAAQWLTSPKEETPIPSADSLKRSFLLQVYCYDTDQGPVLPTTPANAMQSLIVPHNSFAGGRGMLGRAYSRRLPGSYDPHTDEIILDHTDVVPGQPANLGHCAVDLEEGVYYEVQGLKGNGLAIIINAVGLRGGAIVSRVTMIDAKGNTVVVIDGEPICQFCDARCADDARHGQCSCPASLRSRAFGWNNQTSSSSWSSYVQLAKRNMDGGLVLSRVCAGVNPTGETPSRTQLFVDMDGELFENCRTAYVDYVSVLRKTMDCRIISLDLDDGCLDLDAVGLQFDDISLDCALGRDDDGTAIVSLKDSHQGENDGLRKVVQKVKPTSGRTKVICPFCDTLFAKFANLKRHIDAVHEQKREFQCAQCNVRFTQRGNLRRHEAAVHAKTKAFNCELCGANISTSANYQRHLRSQRHIRRAETRRAGITATG